MKAVYYKNEKALRTNRNELLDAGSGIAIASITLWLFVVGKGLRAVAQLRQLRTPNKRQFFIWFNTGWVVLFAALHWYYHYRGVRGDFPPFADSIGIPLYYGTIGLLVFWPVLNLLWLLVLWPVQLGGHLLVKPLAYTWQSVLVEGLCGVWLLIVGLYSISTIIDGDHLTIPVVLLFIYLLLVLRAGHLQAFNQKLQ
ncbi:hypothetical protein [Hymenobacter fodinae]|uniref:Uncharacterized protein n=1 Tax=Hymenobacter fodinae TaxID=2510796 RepID=A0A4Z0P071_9BACT|nr:hypothetical protein [Hymenobacter fodinae]TGE04536.1 hypothetical protein EU556_20325 [Hymenobacter fodinae]